MAGDLVYVVHSERSIAAILCNALLTADFKVVAMTNDSEAEAALSGHKFVLPDAILTPLGDLESGDSMLIKLFTASPLMEQIPVVVVAGDQGDERKRALRMGLLSVIMPPYETEEVALTTQLAIEKHRKEHLLFGSLSQLSVPDLLQTAEAGRRSGKISFQHAGHTGSVWMRDGLVINADIDGISDTEEAVYIIALWNEGTFEANFSPVEVETRFEIFPSELLLEAMRRFDEGLLSPKSMPEVHTTTPPELRAERSLHISLVLLNTVCSYALNHLSGNLLERRIKEVQTDLRIRHPVLDGFKVATDGLISIVPDYEFDDVDACVLGVTRWIIRFFERMEGALAWRFLPKKLAEITRPWHSEIREFKFLTDLGFEDLHEEESGEPFTLEKPLRLGCCVLNKKGVIESFSSFGSRQKSLDPRGIIEQHLTKALPNDLAEAAENLLHDLDVSAGSDQAACISDYDEGTSGIAAQVRIALVRSPYSGRFICVLNRLHSDTELFSPKIERDHFDGTLSDGGSARLLVANEDFLKAFDSLFAKSLAHRRHEILHKFGKKWGLLHALRVEQLVQHDYRMTLREVESQLAIEVLSASVGVMGLGRFKADLNHRERGVVVIRHHHSPFNSDAVSHGDCCCSILAGFHAALFSYLSGRQLAARELACSRTSFQPCVFIVAIEERLSSLFTAASGTSDQRLLAAIAADAASRPSEGGTLG